MNQPKLYSPILLSLAISLGTPSPSLATKLTEGVSADVEQSISTQSRFMFRHWTPTDEQKRFLKGQFTGISKEVVIRGERNYYNGDDKIPGIENGQLISVDGRRYFFFRIIGEPGWYIISLTTPTSFEGARASVTAEIKNYFKKLGVFDLGN